MRVIYTSECGRYRITETLDEHADIENLKGDSYNPKVNTDIPGERLRKEEREFEELVNREGVYGYTLEKWNPSVGVGWEHVDSCWGFVGQYSESDDKFKHYIVEEMKETIKKGNK